MSKPSPLEATESLKHKTDSWITDGAWISGVAGAVTVVLLAMLYNADKVLEKGLNIAGWQLTSERVDSLLAALCIITIVMVGIECVRIFKREGSQFIHKAPELGSGQTGKLFGEALTTYILNLILIGGVTLFYHSAGEYGFANKAPYYQPW
ncbi:MAG TPA: hypothetical protein PK011_14525, partial [Marinagarivorans sp.]|nr:hypothetical protein [Marinagarivorans sp.]